MATQMQCVVNIKGCKGFGVPGEKNTIELYTISKMYGVRKYSLRDFYKDDRWILLLVYSIITRYCSDFWVQTQNIWFHGKYIIMD